MLIAIYAGRDAESALDKGEMHFDQAPYPGDRIKMDGQMLTVRSAWHIPSTTFAGPKFGILVDALGVAAQPTAAQ